MRPALPPLACLLAASTFAAEIHWDGGGGTGSWGAAANWSGDSRPAAGDTVWIDGVGTLPDMLELDTSYPDTEAPINLVLSAGKDLTLSATPGCELYLKSVTVADAQTYTLRVPRTGTQGSSGTMPATGAVWDIVAGGTLVVRDDIGAKASAAGTWTKTGGGTLRIGGDPWSTLASPRLTFQALGGLTEFACLLGSPANGISAVAEGATVRFACYNPFATLLPAGSGTYAAGVTGLSGTLDLGGFDQRLRALGGGATGRVMGNGGVETVVLTLGVGDLGTWVAREADGAFAGSIEDGASGRLQLVVHGGREGYTQTLSGRSTHTGGTVVRGGRLVLAHATDTLSDTGTLRIEGGEVDLGANSESLGDLVISGGHLRGAGGALRAASLLVDNAETVMVTPRLLVDGPAVKRGVGTVWIGGDWDVTGGLTLEAGVVDCQGARLAGEITLLGGALRGGVYAGIVHGQGDVALSGSVSAEGSLATYMARLQTEGLVVDGRLQAPMLRVDGGSVTLNGAHELGSWFGINTFAGGVAYGSLSVVEWGFDLGAAGGYVDGTTELERGVFFGALDAGGSGLSIEAGASLRILADTGSGDFWINPRRFKVAGTLEGGSINGVFVLAGADGSAADGWSTWTDATGLYLAWAGRPDNLDYAPVPESPTVALPCLGLLAGLLRRWAKKKAPRSRGLSGTIATGVRPWSA